MKTFNSDLRIPYIRGIRPWLGRSKKAFVLFIRYTKHGALHDVEHYGRPCDDEPWAPEVESQESEAVDIWYEANREPERYSHSRRNAHHLAWVDWI